MIAGIDHVQIAAPAGCEDDARRFFGGVLGLTELAKPSELARRGGVWFQCGPQQLHIGVATEFAPAAKAHPAFRAASASDLALLAARLEAHGAPVEWDDMSPGVGRFYTSDPWGNRLEILAPESIQGSQHEKATAFRALHEGAAFVIPNPWDPGSAKVLEGLGFKALATTSSGFAFTLGRRDGGASLDEVVEHIRLVNRATSLPVSADLENGYGPDPDAASTAIERAAEAGAVGGSIEDYDPSGPIYSLDHAVERVTAASEAARRLPFPFVLTARAENLIRGNPDLEDTIARLQAYERAGADVLYAPGLRSASEIRAVCQAVSKPVNVLARRDLSLREIVEAGARRVSVGGALTWAAVEALVAAAEKIRDEGDFSPLGASTRLAEWLRADC